MTQDEATKLQAESFKNKPIDPEVAKRLVKKTIILLEENGINHYSKSERIKGNTTYMDFSFSMKLSNKE
jgi:hypothetical protein